MKKYILLATIALALWSCSEERFTEIENPDTGAVAYDPTEVVTIVTDRATRGTPISSATGLTDVGLFCSYTGTTAWTTAATPNKTFNTQLKKNASNAWEYVGNPLTWDAATDNDKYTFFAYAPYESGVYNVSTNPTGNGIVVNGSAATAGIPTLTYTVPTDVTKQPDLMVAVPKKDVLPYATVPMKLEHALTCVEFQIAGNGEKVKDISVTGVYMTGTLKMDGSASPIAWTPSGAKTQSFSASLNTDASGVYTTTPTMSTNLLKGDGYLMMIPQTLGAEAKVKVTYEDNTVSEFSLNGQVWSAGDMKTYHITMEVMVSPTEIILPSLGFTGAANEIYVSCSNQGISWTLQPADTWLELGKQANGTGKGATVSGTGDQVVFTFASENTSTTDNRTTTITLNGTTNTVVNVTQVKKPVINKSDEDASAVYYVGAFWRAEERGERIIGVPSNATPWRATVEWMDSYWADDDIVLALNLNNTPDPGMTFNVADENPGSAESYPVEGIARKGVSGSSSILFRIGLKTTWDATGTGSGKYNSSVPARYAIIVLSYGTNYGTSRRIFLRQGHEADYVMKNGDDAGTESGAGWNGQRDQCVKFSPYNLTAPKYKPGHALYDANFTSTNVTDQAIIPARVDISTTNAPDYFTDYPTQAGAFFQWAIDPSMDPIGGNPYNVYQRRAYHPTVGATVGTSSIFTNWNDDYTFDPLNAYWSQHATTPLKTVNETCPPGWRRPNDGATNVAVERIISDFTTTNNNIYNSEVRQSLWLNPQNSSGTGNLKNSIWGYYADGYFDRRAITTGVGNLAEPSSAVSISSSTPAYRGRLFFNPSTNASLFIPATGLRVSGDGQLFYTGSFSYYWSSSAGSPSSSWSLHFQPSKAELSIPSAITGASVRCVAE